MANQYKDENGHFTSKENDGGPCKHGGSEKSENGKSENGNRKRILGGKYHKSEDGGKTWNEVTEKEYRDFDGEDEEFDATTEDDFKIEGPKNRKDPKEQLEDEEIWDLDFERAYGPLNFDDWDDIALLKKAHEKAVDAGMDATAENALDRIDELETANGKGAVAEKEDKDGTNGWKPSEEATPAYDAGGFYSINKGDRWEYDGGGFVEVHNIAGDNVEITTPSGTEWVTKDELSDMVKEATKMPGKTKSQKKSSIGEDDSWSAENPKYKDFNTSDATNVKIVEEGEEYEDPDSGKKSKLKIIEYTPYGLLRFGRKDRMYGIVGDDYEGGDTHRKGAIVAPSLKSAKAQLKEFTDYYKAQAKEKKR